jgi:hypothetical protein
VNNDQKAGIKFPAFFVDSSIRRYCVTSRDVGKFHGLTGGEKDDY